MVEKAGYYAAGPIYPVGNQTPEGLLHRLAKPGIGTDMAGEVKHYLDMIIQDPKGCVLLVGSSITGFCGNPTKECFGQAETEPDIDIKIVDSVLFSRVPACQYIPQEMLPAGLYGSVSWPIACPDGKLKEKYKRSSRFPYLQELYASFTKLGYPIDMSIYKSMDAIIALGYAFFPLSHGPDFNANDALDLYMAQAAKLCE